MDMEATVIRLEYDPNRSANIALVEYADGEKRYILAPVGLNPGDNMMVIYAVSLPFWCCGFVRPHGMPFEQFVPLWLRANFGSDRIFYVPSMALAGLIDRADRPMKKGSAYGKTYKKQNALRGVESYSPRAGRVIS